VPNVIITSGINLNEFYVVPCDMKNQLSDLMHRLKIYSENASRIPEKWVSIGIACGVVGFESDFTFYRCTPTKIDGDSVVVIKFGFYSVCF